jgi:hypothetical protein
MLLMKRSQPLHRQEPIDAQLGTCGDQIVGERRRAQQDHCARQREQTNDDYSPATVGQAPEGGGGDQSGSSTSPWLSRPSARKTHRQAKAACTAGSARRWSSVWRDTPTFSAACDTDNPSLITAITA